MFHLKPNSTWFWYVKAYFRISLDARPHNLYSFSIVNFNVYSDLGQLGKQDVVFTCPSAIIHKFYMPKVMGQAPISSPARC